jgi:hypothetical protein
MFSLACILKKVIAVPKTLVKGSLSMGVSHFVFIIVCHVKRVLREENGNRKNFLVL